MLGFWFDGMPGANPGPTPNPDPVAWPAAIDSTAESMRPQFRVIAQYEVGPDKPYATPQEALTAARVYQNNRRQADGLIKLTPDYWVDVLIHPGHYTGFIQVPQFCSVIGMTGDPADVVIESATETAGGYASGTAVTGGMQHIEGITLRKGPTTAWPKYPIHHTGHGNTTTNLVNCVLHNDAVATNIGMDGGGGHTFTAYGVTMNGGTNMHGPSETDNPMTMNWVNAAAPSVNYEAKDMASVQNDTWPDHVWIVGGSIQTASVIGAACTTHAPPEVTVTGTGQRDTRQDWAVPVGCATPVTQQHYWPTP